ANGPLSISHYMRLCLTHPRHGYYTGLRSSSTTNFELPADNPAFKPSETDIDETIDNGAVFGHKGDFVTSPEISQMFGELIGIGIVAAWRQQTAGCGPIPIRLVELGPGRGTLMADVLRTIARFPDVDAAVQDVELVEASEWLRASQRKLFSAIAKPEIDDYNESDRQPQTNSTTSDRFWPALIAHEFLDTLPIFKFQLTPDGWREVMIDVDESPDLPYHFRYVLAPGSSRASSVLFPAMKGTVDALAPDAKVGTRIELCPDAARIVSMIADGFKGPAPHSVAMKPFGGYALFIDYGSDNVTGDTLRAIHKHKFIDPLSSPGIADVTADVDFAALRRETLASEDTASDKQQIAFHGPMTQGDYLHAMGIQARLMALLRHASDNETRKNLAMSYQRLVDPKQMGEIYKFMTMT
ncbi:DUF185-domain-containing protein, partial [Ramicandelaber brevisporus]